MSLILDLPDSILFTILTYVASRTNRVHVIFHQLAPLSRSFYESLTYNRSLLFSAILSEDYGCIDRMGGEKKRRLSERLKRTMKGKVRDAHIQFCDRNDIVHYVISEMAHSRKVSLNLQRIRKVFRDYGPILGCNHRSKIGGTFLIECCRARYVTERVILACIKELVEKHGSLPNVSSSEISNINRNVDYIYPICIASARAMPKVCQYLIQKGASVNIKGTGRFRLKFNPRKSIYGTYTPLRFAKVMRENETKFGASSSDLVNLDQCIQVLVQNGAKD